MTGSFLTFELRRQSGDLVYRFHRQTAPGGLAGYKREDADLWITFRPGLGWVAWDEEEGCMGRPWNVPPDQQTDHPPAGVWVSRKGAKSYVYDLVYVG